MNLQFDWNPDPHLLNRSMTLAEQKHRSPESIVTEAVTQYLTTQLPETSERERQVQTLQGIYRHIAPDVSLADELIQDRRAEAQQETQ
jgi:hypothetical protein